MMLLAEGDDDDLPTPTIVAVAATSAVADAIAMADPIMVMEDRVQLQGTAVAVIFFVNSRGMTNAALVAALGWGRPRIMVGRLLFAAIR